MPTATRKKILGSEVPRVFTPPLRPLTPETSAGFAVIQFAEDILGVFLLPWQKWLVIHALELTPDDQFRFRTVVVLVARQNGKSTLGQVLALWFLYVRQVGLIIGTAQSLDIASDLWRGTVELAEEVDVLADEIAKISRLNSREMLELKNRSKYKVTAATRRGGRGLSSDLVLLDELREHQTWDAWGALTKTTLARPDAQIWALSNAGDDTSIVLSHLRRMAHIDVGDPDGLAHDEVAMLLDAPPESLEIGGDDGIEEIDIEETDPSTLGVFEWSADPGCNKWDRNQWAKANPSMNYTLPDRNIADACRTDPEWVFRTEVLCQWPAGTLVGPFGAGSWAEGNTFEPPAAGTPFVCGLDVSGDRTKAHVVIAYYRTDGRPQVNVEASRPGTGWLVDWFTSKATRLRPLSVVVQERGAPASSLIEELEQVPHLTVVKWGGPDLGNGTALMFDRVDVAPGEEHTRLMHLPSPALDMAAAVARTRDLTDGGKAWDRRQSPADIAPLVAATAALWLLNRQALVPTKRSAYEHSGMMMLD